MNSCPETKPVLRFLEKAVREGLSELEKIKLRELAVDFKTCALKENKEILLKRGINFCCPDSGAPEDSRLYELGLDFANVAVRNPKQALRIYHQIANFGKGKEGE